MDEENFKKVIVALLAGFGLAHWIFIGGYEFPLVWVIVALVALTI
jgi:hypothetical protein